MIITVTTYDGQTVRHRRHWDGLAEMRRYAKANGLAVALCADGSGFMIYSEAGKLRRRSYPKLVGVVR